MTNRYASWTRDPGPPTTLPSSLLPAARTSDPEQNFTPQSASGFSQDDPQTPTPAYSNNNNFLPREYAVDLSANPGTNQFPHHRRSSMPAIHEVSRIWQREPGEGRTDWTEEFGGGRPTDTYSTSGQRRGSLMPLDTTGSGSFGEFSIVRYLQGSS